MAWFRYRLSHTTPEAGIELYRLPGVVARGTAVQVPCNAVPVVEAVLARHNLRWSVERIGEPDSPIDCSGTLFPRLVEHGLRDWVPEFLTPYQRAAVCRFAGRSGHFHHAAGGGKTLTSICWALASPGATLVTTKAGVRRQFAREIERFTLRRALVVEESAALTPELLAETDATFLVVGHEMLPDVVDRVLHCWKPTVWIADEIHSNKSSKRWEAIPQADGKIGFKPRDNMAYAAMRVSRAVKLRLGLTATPVKDRVRDLWAQLDLVHPDAWGRFYSEKTASFTQRYCAAQRGVFGNIDTSGASNLEELAVRMKRVCDVVPYSVSHRELPPKRRVVTFIPARDQNAPAGGFAAVMKKAAKSGRSALVEAKLMEAASRKRKAVQGILDDAIEAKWKVVVFTGRREDCDRLHAETTQKFPEALVLRGHGGDSPAARDETVRSFMAAPGPAILVGTGDAFGTGINLNDADLLLVAMLPYTPGQTIQWEGRCCRLGQKRPVLVQYLVAEGTVDEHVAGILTGKLPAVERTTGDDSVTGFADQLAGADDEEAILDSILAKMGGAS